MTAYELLDIGLSLGNRIDMQWTLFITVHLALFGGIIYVDRPLRAGEKIGTLVIYGFFAFLNFRVMHLQIELLDSTFREIAKLADAPCCSNNTLLAYVAGDVASGRLENAKFILVAGHILTGLLVLVSVIFDDAISSSIKRSPRKSKRHES